VLRGAPCDDKSPKNRGISSKMGISSAKVRILPSKMVTNGDSNIEHRKPTIKKIRDKW
jgi:hypothetical protein